MQRWGRFTSMSYLALASDYDGTLAEGGRVSRETLDALWRWKAAGRKFILVTGRELRDLPLVFPEMGVCDIVVAENGALLHNPVTGSTHALAAKPSAELIAALGERGVAPIEVGEVILAAPAEALEQILDAIRHLRLPLQTILNLESVMILPTGTDKQTGLGSALEELGLAWTDVVGVGDAENDQVFLEACGYSAAVANAIPAVKEVADFVCTCSRGAGVAELIEVLLSPKI